MPRGGSDLMFGGVLLCSFDVYDFASVWTRSSSRNKQRNSDGDAAERNWSCFKVYIECFSNSMIWIDLPKVVHIRDTKKLILSCLGTGLVLTCNLSISMICFDCCKVVHIRQTMRITSPFRLARVHEHRSHKRHQHRQMTTGMDYR